MSADRPRVLTVVSCGDQKQDFDPGEAAPARELYTSFVHVCKDRYGRHSDGYYIASAKYGLVRHDIELPYYDRSLHDLTEIQRRAWARDVTDDLISVVDRRDFGAVVAIAGETYVDPLVRPVDRIPVPLLTPWQTDGSLTSSHD